MIEYANKAHNLYNITLEKEYIENSVSKLLPMLMDQDKELFIVKYGDTKALCRLMTISNATPQDIMKTDETNEAIHQISVILDIIFRFVKNVLSKELFYTNVYEISIYTESYRLCNCSK